MDSCSCSDAPFLTIILGDEVIAITFDDAEEYNKVLTRAGETECYDYEEIDNELYGDTGDLQSGRWVYLGDA